MKRFAAIVTLAVSLVTLSCSRYETAGGDPLGTKVYTLDNGFKVCMSVNMETPRIRADRFRNTVIRGFHTGLVTICEEMNMSFTSDSRKLREAFDNALFPHPPCGTRTVPDSREHLKNPSITNGKKYRYTYYVPNNIAICVAGDFNPDEMVKTGGRESNPSVPALEYEAETLVTEPAVKEVYGLEAENVAVGWGIPKASDVKSSAIAGIVSAILYNGQAGLIDLDVDRRQKILSAYAGCHFIDPNGEAPPERHIPYAPVDGSGVLMAQYDSRQIYYIRYNRSDRTFNPESQAVLSEYRKCRRLGLEEPMPWRIFEKSQSLALRDVCSFQQEWVKGLNCKYAIPGDIKDLDMKHLGTLGPVRVLTQKDIFGY